MDSPDNRSPTGGSASIGLTLIRWLKAALALNQRFGPYDKTSFFGVYYRTRLAT